MLQDYLTRKRNIFAPTTLHTVKSKLNTILAIGLEPNTLFNTLKEQGYGLYTIRQYMVTAAGYETFMLRSASIATWLSDNRHVFRNAYQRKETLPTVSLVERLINGAPTQGLRNAVILMAYAGLRISEVEAAKWDDFEGQVLVVTGKGKKIRRVPMSLKHLESLGSCRPGYLIAEVCGLSQFLKTATSSLHTAHDFRAFYISYLLNDLGFSVSEVRDLVGHSSIATTDKYSRVDADKLSQKIQTKLGA